MSNELKDIVNKYRRTKKLTTGKEVSVKLLGLAKGLAVAKNLMKVVTPLIGGAADGLRHDSLVHGAPRSFTELALTLCDQIDKIEVVDLVTVILDDMYIEGNPVDIDEYFMGNWNEFLEIMEFALRENFETFFMGKGIKARLTQTMQTMMLGLIPEESESE